MQNTQKRVGVVSFTDPPTTGFISEREIYIKQNHQELVDFITANDFLAIDPLKEMRKPEDTVFGIHSTEEVFKCADILNRQKPDCIIIGLLHWTDPYLAVGLTKFVQVPVMLYTCENVAWGGTVLLSAVGASLWETGATNYGVLHERAIDARDTLLHWIRGVCAVQEMKRSSVLLWGDSYCLKVEHLQDDIPKLKSFMIYDILSEGQYILVKRAEKILHKEPKRINHFINWLQDNGAKVIYNPKMLTPEVFRKEVALYLACRDRLNELADENIMGVSIKCQHELSVEYGITPCLVPSFLPFPEDDKGQKPIISTTCEGDLKGLLTCCLLNLINPDCPALFGDLRNITDEYILISNCGGSSIYHAGNSNKASEVLNKVTIAEQCQGEAGGAVGYNGKADIMTVARLMRIQGRYYMQLGIGESLDVTEELRKSLVFGQSWPLVAISLGVDRDKLARITGSNHYSAVTGDYTKEVEYFCRQLQIPVIRIDNNNALDRFYTQLRSY